MTLRSRWFLVIGLGLTFLPAGVTAQHTIHDVFIEQPISLFDPGLYAGSYGSQLASTLPRYIYRPMDDLAPRPGADAMGMGGAHLALADDAMALGWNPANLGQLRHASLCLDGYLRSSSGTGSHLPDTVVVEGYGDFDARSYRASLTQGASFGFCGAAAPLVNVGPRPLVGGVAYRRHTDVAFGEATVLEMGLFTQGAGFPFVLGIDNQERGSIESLTLGLAYEPISLGGVTLALGGSANFLTGRLRSDVLLRAAVRNFEEGKVQFRRDYKGFEVETGVLATVQDKVRLAGWASLPHRIKVENSHFVSMPLILPDATDIERVHGSIAGYDMELPLFLSAGLAVGPIRGVIVAVDVNHRPWSETDVVHHDPAMREFDGPLPAADVTSYHFGGSFPFPLLRGAFERSGLDLTTEVGYRTLPLSMRQVDFIGGESQPFYYGDQIEGHAMSLGFTLQTRAEFSFHLGFEFQSYSFNKWFLDDQRDPLTEGARELRLTDALDQVTRIDRNNTVLRFSSEMRL